MKLSFIPLNKIVYLLMHKFMHLGILFEKYYYTYKSKDY